MVLYNIPLDWLNDSPEGSGKIFYFIFFLLFFFHCIVSFELMQIVSLLFEYALLGKGYGE